MKVIGINGSARKDGNTAMIMQVVLDELKKAGITTALLQLAGQEIKPCRGCFACKGKKQCIIQDDVFHDYWQSMVAAEGILLGSPVYSADVSATMKALLERAGVIAATNPGLLQHKVGAAVVAVRRGGGMTAVDTLNHFFLNKEMILPGSTYWNIVYGKDIGDVQGDEEGMANMRNLGKNMAWLLKRMNT